MNKQEIESTNSYRRKFMFNSLSFCVLIGFYGCRSSGDVNNKLADRPVKKVADGTVKKASPLDFGAKADGVSDDTNAIRAVLAAITDHDAEINWGEYKYYCGEVNIPVSGGVFNEHSAKFEVVNKTNLKFVGKPTFLVDNKLKLSGTTPAGADLWRFTDCADLKLEINVISDFFNPTTPQGVCALMLVADEKDTSGYDVTVNATNCLAALQTCRKNNAISSSNPHNIVGLTIDLTAINGEYGYRAINCGYNVHGRIKTKGIVRSYFIVGVQNHVVDVDSVGQRKFMDVLIKSYSDPVKNINILFKQRNSIALEWPISIEHENYDDNTVIQSITIKADIAGRAPDGKAYFPELVQVGRSLDFKTRKLREATNCITDDINIVVNYDANESKENAGITTPTYNNKGGVIRSNLPILSKSNNFNLIKINELKNSN